MASLLPFPSRQSVDLARAVMLSERAQVTAQTGLRFASAPCEFCSYVADAMGITDGIAYGRAVCDVIRHSLHAHGAVEH